MLEEMDLPVGGAQPRAFATTAHQVTSAEIDTVVDLCNDPDVSFMSQVTMAAWGERSL